jgi:putative transposase
MTSTSASTGSGWLWTAPSPRPASGRPDTGPNPTDRAKTGTKRSVICDAAGVPIGLAVAAANRHDQKPLEPTLDALIVRPPEPDDDTEALVIGLCLDRGYRTKQIPVIVAERGMLAYIQGRDEEIAAREFDPTWKPRRWVIERTHSWLNRFRGLLIRWSKKTENHTAFLQLACAVITWRSIPRHLLPRWALSEQACFVVGQVALEALPVQLRRVPIVFGRGIIPATVAASAARPDGSLRPGPPGRRQDQAGDHPLPQALHRPRGLRRPTSRPRRFHGATPPPHHAVTITCSAGFLGPPQAMTPLDIQGSRRRSHSAVGLRSAARPGPSNAARAVTSAKRQRPGDQEGRGREAPPAGCAAA